VLLLTAAELSSPAVSAHQGDIYSTIIYGAKHMREFTRVLEVKVGQGQVASNS